LEQQLRQLESHLHRVEERLRTLLPEDTGETIELKNQDIAQALSRMPHH
jgi:hypothetical protein